MLALKNIMHLYSDLEGFSFNFESVFTYCIFAKNGFLKDQSFGFKKPCTKFLKIVLNDFLAPKTME